MILHDIKRASNKGEQIGRLGVWVVPDGKMPVGITGDSAVFDGIAICEQYWCSSLFGVNTNRIN
ncbi:hypothetical protein D3C80_1938490 [compost metagenome]